MPKKNQRLVPVQDLAEIPQFRTENEEAEFWGSHSFGSKLLDQGGALPADALPDEWEASHRRAVILTALPVEYSSVRSHLTRITEDVHQRGTVYEVGTFETGRTSWSVGMCQVRAGNANAALEAERAIEHFHPNIVLFVGVAGGLKEVRLGDVVAADRVYNYHAGKAGETFEPRGNLSESS